MIVTFSPRQRDYAPAEFLAAGRPKAHPDVPARLDGLLAGVAAGGHAIMEPEDHGLAHVARVHDPRYLDFLETAHEAWRQLPQAADQVVPNVHPRRSGGPYPRAIVGRAGYHLYDMSCPITAETWNAVLWNAHSAASAALRVADGAAPSAYALCRPPGHHAGPDYAGGFCFLNNAAVAADILCRRFGRVATLDIDVHHGNGTQDIFYDRADVLTVSLHGDPADFYPFYWGHADETGTGAGTGFNRNIPLPRGLADDAYLGHLADAIATIAAYRPAALVVSVGFDTYEHDPLAWLRISTAGFGRIGAAIAGLGLPTVLVQEGGYMCEDLAKNLASFLGGFEAG